MYGIFDRALSEYLSQSHNHKFSFVMSSPQDSIQCIFGSFDVKLCIILFLYNIQGECFSNTVEYLDTQTLTWHAPRVTVSKYQLIGVPEKNS